MADLGKMLVIAGAVIVLIGAFLWWSPRIPFLGKLPGDIIWKKGNFTFYFPIVTCIIISVALTLLFWLLSKR